MTDNITFSFGQNWCDFLSNLPSGAVEGAQKDIELWLSKTDIEGKKILDIGSGSGLHSLCFHRLGAASVTSFDVDPHSVAATTRLWRQAGEPTNWQVLQQSILDRETVNQLGTFDLVYSWGVLHHTGAMWQALENAATRVAKQGLLWIALYAAGPQYPYDLKLKQRYNRAGTLGKNILVVQWVLREKFSKLMRLQNPFSKQAFTERGMSPLHDIRDWLGGLPYEVAGVEETTAFLAERGLGIEKVMRSFEGSNHIFLFRQGKHVPKLQDPFVTRPNRTLVFGASVGGKNTTTYLKKQGFQVIGLADNDSQKQGTKVMALPVHPPAQIQQLEYDSIHIGSGYRTEIWSQLVALGVDSNLIQTLPDAILSGPAKPLAKLGLAAVVVTMVLGMVALLT